jgi:hypothetical protein
LDHLRRLASIGVITKTEWEQLEPITKQLKSISDVRNTVLHYGASNVAEGSGFVPDAIMALTADRAKVFPISPEILDDMAQDLGKIFLHLVTRHMGRPALRGKHPKLERVLNAAWRYTPPRQGRNRSHRDANTLAPISRPKSSPA